MARYGCRRVSHSRAADERTHVQRALTEPLTYRASARPCGNKKGIDMRILKGAAIALLLSGTALATTGLARASDYYGNNYGNDRSNRAVLVQFGDVAMGYRDGYLDNEHRWHRWNNHGDYRNYRNEHRDTYRDYDHDRGNSNIAIGFSNRLLTSDVP